MMQTTAGADDDGRGLHHVGVRRWPQASSTRILVGLATTSKTAERFWD